MNGEHLPGYRVVLAESWWVASELVRRNPELKLIETHPGGGQYDCLSLVRQDRMKLTAVIDLNRAGRMHVHNTASGRPFEPLTWSAALAGDDAHSIVKQLEAAAGLAPASPAPPTGPAAATFRVIARLMAALVHERSTWDVRNELHHSLGQQASGPDTALQAFPQLRGLALERRGDDVLGEPRYGYWALLENGEVRSMFDTGGTLDLPGGESRDLLELYRRSGRSLTAVLGAALGDVLP